MPAEIIHITLPTTETPPRKTTPREGVQRYVILTLEDAVTMAEGVDGCAGSADRIAQRFRGPNPDTGADIEDIADRLMVMDTCVACSHEGMESHCQVLPTRFQGRRLRRLLERARGERAPGPGDGGNESKTPERRDGNMG